MEIENLKKKSRPQGFVLPSLIMLTMVLLMIATTLLASGTTSLRVATFDQQSDQALYAAEAGLTKAAQMFAAEGSISQPFEGDLGSSSSRYSVVAYENPGETELTIPGGLTIPPATVYLHSEGTSENGTRRLSGALFSMGLQAFKVGALGNTVRVNNASFDAYNSANGAYGPDTVQNDLPLLASNASSGETFVFENADVAGDIFVGPGGDPASQISNTNSTIGDVTAMSDAIALENIEVPADSDDDDDLPSIPAVGQFQMVSIDTSGVYHFTDTDGMNITIDPAAWSASDPFGHIDFGGLNVIQGNEPDGSKSISIQTTGTNGHLLYVTDISKLAYHGLVGSGSPSGGYNELLSDLFFNPSGFTGAAPPANVTNPSTLEPGHYDSVTIEDGFQSNLSPDGVYVIKNLTITGNGKLNLPPDGVNATFYVTESLTIDGENALVNETLKAPKMKVFYTGPNDVSLSGGSQSYFTLVAPEANITLDAANPGIRTQFYGALVGNNVTVNNASFHFDTATSGIGTGTMGSAVVLLNRHRL